MTSRQTAQGTASSLAPEVQATYKMSNYAASRGATAHIAGGSCNCSQWSLWNSQFNSTYPGLVTPYPDLGNDPTVWATFSGPFTRLSYHTKMQEITDGTSNTIMEGDGAVDAA